MDNSLSKVYRDRLRILLIIYFFSEPYYNQEKPKLVALLKSEVRIQKLDFLIRYPSYLCYELITKMRENSAISRDRVKQIVKSILYSGEPEIRTHEMRKFLYGAWEELDKIISFLKSHGLVHFESQISSSLKQYNKSYYLTSFGKEKVEAGLKSIPSLKWYEGRCSLIKEYFGDLSGSELKALQYQHSEYKEAMINTYIKDIEVEIKRIFTEEFQESYEI